MSDDIWVARPKMRRKKRKAEGVDEILAAITPDRPMLELGKDKGLKCRECGKWISWKDLWAKYEKQSNDLMRLWICSRCGNVLRQDNMDGYEAHVEWQQREEGSIGKRILICGDRNWTDVKAIAKVMRGFDPHTSILICGMARGADRISYQLAKGTGWRVMEFPADWDKHGRAAGPIRNAEMLTVGKPELVIAFHDDLDNSKGTANMVKIAKRAGVRVRLVRHKVQR